jgi:hypothetical protein
MVYSANCTFWMTYFVVCIQLLWGCLPLLLLVKKNRIMGLFRRPLHEKECSYYVHSRKYKCYVMFPLSSASVNYDVTILFFSSMCIKNVLCFLQKKFVCKMFCMSILII